MPNGGNSLDALLTAQLHTLADIEPSSSPVVSLYLDLAPDQHGRDDAYDAFCRRVFAEQLKAHEGREAERAALARAFERIDGYLATELQRSSNGVAIFAGDGLFEAVQIGAPIDDHWLFIGAVPHLYPLVRLHEQYPRYAALLLDRHRARIIVFSLGAVESRAEVTGEKTRRHSMGGWSQSRYQRHTDNLHLQHVKEVVATLERVVRDDDVQHVIVAGDADFTARLREQLPAALAAKVVDEMRLDRHAGEDRIVAEALDALRRKDGEDDAQRVAAALDATHAGGLGVTGPAATVDALRRGQVDELLLVSDPAALQPVHGVPEGAPPPAVAATSANGGADAERLRLSDFLVATAVQTGARVRMIEDAELLRGHGGVAASLRYRI